MVGLLVVFTTSTYVYLPAGLLWVPPGFLQIRAPVESFSPCCKVNVIDVPNRGKGRVIFWLGRDLFGSLII